ncbi:hypothetical protein [Larkinella punicea]|uniref:hypothetical protein n=1 Tax=Larkinella punicea TaxID=2315727 RepID=UPI00105867C1|nr:hypothetical protein [Larkinella punicea]
MPERKSAFGSDLDGVEEEALYDFGQILSMGGQELVRGFSFTVYNCRCVLATYFSAIPNCKRYFTNFE